MVAKYPDGGVVMDEHVTAETVAELSAALATAQQEKAEALALLGKMREAGTKALAEAESWVRDQLEGTRGFDKALADLNQVRAALSTPAPAALEEMRERIRAEALEEAALHLEAENDDGTGYVDTEIRWAVETIRAMKREGEG